MWSIEEIMLFMANTKNTSRYVDLGYGKVMIHITKDPYAEYQIHVGMPQLMLVYHSLF